MKLWLMLAVIGVIWWWLAKKKLPLDQPRKPQQPAVPAVEVMVPCAVCELHVPASEALSDAAGAYFCCEQHRRLQRDA